MKKLSQAFATVDILVSIALVAGLVGLTVSYVNNSFTADAGNVASCSQESALLADAIACTRAQQAGGGGVSCADVDACVLGSASMAAKWPDLTTDGAGNLSIGSGTGANNVADNEVTCAGNPASLTLHCTDDTFATTGGGNTCTPVTEVCGNNIDDDCDGEIDEDCASSLCPCFTANDIVSRVNQFPLVNTCSNYQGLISPFYINTSGYTGYSEIRGSASFATGQHNGLHDFVFWAYQDNSYQNNYCYMLVRPCNTMDPELVRVDYTGSASDIQQQHDACMAEIHNAASTLGL